MAAAAYDYENDPRWADYWSDILIPPHMASRSDVVDHFKRKFYQRYIDPDLAVEAMSSGSPSRSSKPSASSSTSSAANDGSRTRNACSTSRSSRASATASMRWDQRTIQFSVNAWVYYLPPPLSFSHICILERRQIIKLQATSYKEATNSSNLKLGGSKFPAKTMGILKTLSHSWLGRHYGTLASALMGVIVLALAAIVIWSSIKEDKARASPPPPQDTPEEQEEEKPMAEPKEAKEEGTMAEP
ncbi:uncharacterized protein LOC120209022 [Hibiscus syriacus]|uniref:uncharacterized protein LOC120209022 n=1 Tax=Hibiscus syriacus TaxID=106335 RepID=UPI001923EA8A|nr:uncharacterized protein LOC120209022 [Hibiscus syriacus]